MKHRFNSANLDLLANYFYLSGYTVGKVKEVVPSNFSPDDPFQGQTVGGLSINRVFRYGQFSEVIILTSGVAYIKVVNQNGTHTFKGAYPAEIETAKKVIEEVKTREHGSRNWKSFIPSRLVWGISSPRR